MTYRDRRAAGADLARRLAAFAGRSDVVVLGLVRGGVPVAVEVAARLNAPLDVLIVRKLGVPWAPEVAFGALGPAGVKVLNERVVARLEPSAVRAVVRREQAELARRERREPLMRDLYAYTQDSLSDEELFDLLPLVTEGSLEELEDNEQVTHMLAGLSQSDAQVIRMAVLYDMDGSAVAQALNIPPATARQRLHRALHRLRASVESGVRDNE